MPTYSTIIECVGIFMSKSNILLASHVNNWNHVFVCLHTSAVKTLCGIQVLN